MCSDTLMLDNTLIPLSQERVTSLTFNTEHTSKQLESDDDEHSKEFLVMTGTGRGAGEQKFVKQKCRLVSIVRRFTGKLCYESLMTNQ